MPIIKSSSSVLLFGLALLFQTNTAAQTLQTSPDRHTFLTVDGRAFSAYFFDKYYGRFIQGSPHGDVNAHESIRDWFSQLLCQQVVIAYAESKDFDRNPMVQETVGRMERYMLTQPEGPFYEQLYPKNLLSEESLRARYDDMAESRDVLLIHYSKGSTTDAIIGANFSARPANERLRVINSCVHDADVMSFDGPMGWPYFPFSEIAQQLKEAQAGGWVEVHDPLLGSYVGIVRSIAPKKIPEFTQLRPLIIRISTESTHREIQLRHRVLTLKTAGFEYNQNSGQHLLAVIDTLSEKSLTIPLTAVGDLSTTVLASYINDRKLTAITVSDFIDYWNRQFIRTLPADKSILRQQVEDLVLQNIDYESAQALKIDQTPQFAEDRQGFRYFQILDCFEKQVLAKQANLTEGDIKDYYSKHQKDFMRATSVEGHFVQANGKAPDEHEPPVQIVSGAIGPLPEGVVPALMSAPWGAKFGPFERSGKSFIFIKDRNVDSTLAPMEEVAQQIQAKLLRPQLDQLERKLARDVAQKFTVVDRIPYERFGLDKKEVDRPWAD